ncbi:MAG: LapA family protein [Gammaproteobacteria bacterium]|nr:LapA family protein [Gammaproteobacteria bacterium]
MKKIVSYISMISILILGTIFSIYNADNVVINLVMFKQELPLAFLLILTLILGAALGVLTTMSMMYRTRRELNKLKKQDQINKTEINNLRTIPFKD